MKQAKLIAGIKSLLKNSSQYQFHYSQNITYQCTIKELYQQQLQKQYPLVTLQDLAQQFQEYLLLPVQLLGKRSSQIMVSSHKKYCCKLMDQDSYQKLTQVIKDVWEYKMNNKQTYLIDIYRIFTVESIKDNFKQTDIFMFMPCLRPNFQDSLAIYDIKGHTQVRNLDHQDFKVFKFGKDQNFVISKQVQLIPKISKEQREKFVQIISKDVNFLLPYNIIDYSLLLSFRRATEDKITNNKKINHFKIGDGFVMEWFIIDYFQEYNGKKKAENKFKSLFRKQVSSVQPNTYANRFVSFFKKYFII